MYFKICLRGCSDNSVISFCLPCTLSLLVDTVDIYCTYRHLLLLLWPQRCTLIPHFLSLNPKPNPGDWWTIPLRYWILKTAPELIHYLQALYIGSFICTFACFSRLFYCAICLLSSDINLAPEIYILYFTSLYFFDASYTIYSPISHRQVVAEQYVLRNTMSGVL
jgi:hypothetical protein